MVTMSFDVLPEGALSIYTVGGDDTKVRVMRKDKTSKHSAKKTEEFAISMLPLNVDTFKKAAQLVQDLEKDKNDWHVLLAFKESKKPYKDQLGILAHSW